MFPAPNVSSQRMVPNPVSMNNYDINQLLLIPNGIRTGTH